MTGRRILSAGSRHSSPFPPAVIARSDNQHNELNLKFCSALAGYPRPRRLEPRPAIFCRRAAPDGWLAPTVLHPAAVRLLHAANVAPPAASRAAFAARLELFISTQSGIFSGLALSLPPLLSGLCAGACASWLHSWRNRWRSSTPAAQPPAHPHEPHEACALATRDDANPFRPYKAARKLPAGGAAGGQHRSPPRSP